MGHETPPHWDRSMRDRLRRGEAAALAELYDRFVSLAYAIARRVLDDEEDIGRVTREVFAHLWESPDDFDPDQGPMRTWIAAEAHRRALDELRAQVTGEAPAGPSEPDDPNLPPADGPGTTNDPLTPAGPNGQPVPLPASTAGGGTTAPPGATAAAGANGADPPPLPNAPPAPPARSPADEVAGGVAGKADALHAASTAARADYIVTAMPAPLRDALELTRFEHQDYRRMARALGITESEACRRLRLGLQLLSTAAEYPMGTTREEP